MDMPAFWFTEVLGDAYDVDDLPHFFPSGTTFAYREEGRTWLKSDRYLLDMTAAQVHAEAERVLDEMSGALCIFLGHYQRPKTGTVYLQHSDGHKTGHHILKVDGAAIRSKARAALEGSSGPTVPQQFVLAAKRSPHLQTASLIWTDQVRTWPRLYRVMEEVQQHFGMPPYSAGLCGKAEYKNFEHTANSAEAAGLDARHALGKFEAPAAPMTLPMAEAFVGRVLERTFRRVIGVAHLD
jgi:hypothetical protein